MFRLHSKYLVTSRLVPTCNDQKNAHSNVNITSSQYSESKRTHHVNGCGYFLRLPYLKVPRQNSSNGAFFGARNSDNTQYVTTIPTFLFPILPKGVRLCIPSQNIILIFMYIAFQLCILTERQVMKKLNSWVCQ